MQRFHILLGSQLSSAGLGQERGPHWQASECAQVRAPPRPQHTTLTARSQGHPHRYTTPTSAPLAACVSHRDRCFFGQFGLLLFCFQTTKKKKKIVIMVRQAVKAASLVVLASSSFLVAAHPLCFYGPDRAVSTDAEATFCPDENPEGFCCDADEEAALDTKYTAVEASLSAECAPLYKEVRCRRQSCRGLLVFRPPQVRCCLVGGIHTGSTYTYTWEVA